jgi:hypothetical protein
MGQQWLVVILCSPASPAFLTRRTEMLINHWPSGVKPGDKKIQSVIQESQSRFRLVFASVSVLFTQTIAMATLFAPERRLITRILRLLA